MFYQLPTIYLASFISAINMQQLFTPHAWSVPSDKHPHSGTKQQWHFANRGTQGFNLFESIETGW